MSPAPISAEHGQTLAELRAENDALRAALAQVPAPVPTDHRQLVRLLEELYAAVVVADREGLVTWVSAGFTALCGFELADVVGRRPGRYVRPALSDPQTLAYIERCVRDHQPFQYEARNPRPGREADWIRVKVQPLRNAQGEVTVMAGMLEDITEWKHTQLRLDQSEHRFQLLAESVPVVLYEWHEPRDGAAYFGYVSPKLQEVFGIAVADFQPLQAYTAPEDLPALDQSRLDALQALTPWFYEGRFHVPGQPLRWVRGTATVCRQDATEVVYSGILEDITPLKQAQAAQRETDVRLRVAFKGVGDGAWEMDLRTRGTYFSPEYKAMLGYADAEFANEYENWLRHVHPEDLEERLRIMATYLRGDSPVAADEYRLRCQDGTYKWVMSRALVTARDAAGSPLTLTGIHTDITALKTAELELQVSTRRLSTVITHLQAGIVLEDENRRVVLTNDAMCALLRAGAAPAEYIGRGGSLLAEAAEWHVEDPAAFGARIAALLRERRPAEGDVVRLRDGRTLLREFTPVYDDQQRHIGQLWKYEDITARAAADAELRRREEKYRGIIESMSLGLVEVDLEDRVLYVNRSFCAIIGFDEAEMLGRELAPFFLSGPDLALLRNKNAMRRQGLADSYELSFTTKAGENKWMLVSGAPVYDQAGQFTGSIGINLDITPQKSLEISLREAKALAESSARAKQDFLANMSHEIRTPMNAIQGMSRLLAKTPLRGPQASYLHAITASAENLLVIIDDILDWSKIEAGRLDIEVVGFGPRQVCAQVERTLQYKIEEKGLTFVTHVGAAVPAVLRSDPHRLHQILLNLAGNAVKFTERGQVSVGCALVRPPADGVAEVEFTVQDTGVGIDPAYLARAFDDFSQEDSSVTRRFGGTGLGLGISRRLVALLGGELRIESEKNRGTTARFVLRLPVGAAQDLPQKNGADAGHWREALRGRRVLLVEDNVFNRLLARITLTNAGLEVTEAENGAAAVAAVRAAGPPFDVVLMDVHMPVLNGYDATAVLRGELGLTLPIIALTANAITGERTKCLAAGMNDYLTKPFQEGELLKMVYDWVVGPQHEGVAAEQARDGASGGPLPVVTG